MPSTHPAPTTDPKTTNSTATTAAATNTATTNSTAATTAGFGEPTAAAIPVANPNAVWHVPGRLPGREHRTAGVTTRRCVKPGIPLPAGPAAATAAAAKTAATTSSSLSTG